MANNDNITFEIKRHCGVIAENQSTHWRKELNIVAWNGGEPKFDIREWSSDHTKMTRGITLTREQAVKVVEILNSSL